MEVSIYYLVVLVHVLAVVATVGAVSVIDYLHLIGLRKKKLEQKLLFIYPLVSKVIHFGLIGIYATGLSLVFLKSTLLQNPLFIVKITLVLLVTANGWYLQRKISPSLTKCVLKGTKYCEPEVLHASVLAGSFSIVTWYAIVVLSLTKTIGYTPQQFIAGYILAWIFVGSVAWIMEKRARHWRKK